MRWGRGSLGRWLRLVLWLIRRRLGNVVTRRRTTLGRVSNILFVILLLEQRELSSFLLLPGGGARRAGPSQLYLELVAPLALADLARLTVDAAPRPVQRPRRLDPERRPLLLGPLLLPRVRFQLQLELLLPLQQRGVALDVRDVPPPLGLLDDAHALLPEVLHEVCQRGPFRGVHVNVALVLYDFLVNIVGVHPLRAVPPPQSLEVDRLKFTAEGVHHTPGIVPEYTHVAQVRVGCEVALEAVLVAALLLTHLAIEFELLKSLGLHSIGNVLRRTLLGLWHDGKSIDTCGFLVRCLLWWMVVSLDLLVSCNVDPVKRSRADK
mmetsp:Transcript_14319/g.32857  ORF Transcript_14319/g.32857 Transcript_14319/m.32857 type:complete len:322 (+) Transcript_14319:487-1452(+)